MKKTLVIGDIHGCYQSLVKLLELIDDIDATIIFLGDYIDRGPDSRKVIDLILQLRKERPCIITLLGNHEAMFLRYLNGGYDNTLFFQSGGQATLDSYGIDSVSECALHSYVPPEHLIFFNSLLLNWEDAKYIYVHAGLQPGLHLSLQTDDWCLWARDEFIYSSFDYGKRVIFGHTVFEEPYVRPEKVGIDTGAAYGGKLTCFVLPDEEFLTVSGQKSSK